MTTKIDRILQTLDKLFEEHKMEKVEPFLQQALKESMETGDSSAVITIVNELIGFYSDTSQYEKDIFHRPYRGRPCGLHIRRRRADRRAAVSAARNEGA